MSIGSPRVYGHYLDDQDLRSTIRRQLCLNGFARTTSCVPLCIRACSVSDCFFCVLLCALNNLTLTLISGGGGGGINKQNITCIICRMMNMIQIMIANFR